MTVNQEQLLRNTDVTFKIQTFENDIKPFFFII